MNQPRTIAALTLVLALGAAACGSTSSGGDPGAGSSDPIQIEAGLYPLAWISEQVGGDDVAVSSLTPDGAEPHDLELSPQQVGRIADADLVVTLAGFQPAVDEATSTSARRVFEAAQATDLREADSEHEHEHEHEGEHEDEGEHESGLDPHFWLDPIKLGEVAEALAVEFADLRPDLAADFERRAGEVVGQLEEIDATYRGALGECESRDLVTSHEAFGYLADRYGFTQQGVAGLRPTSEPSPKELGELSEYVQEHDVTTIYSETLVSDRVAQTVAAEAGVTVAVLDPIEGLSDASVGDDYLAVMASNLEVLTAGQAC